MTITINNPVKLYAYEELDLAGRARAESDYIDMVFMYDFADILADNVRQDLPTTADDVNWSYVLEGRGRGLSLWGRFSLDDMRALSDKCGVSVEHIRALPEGLVFETTAGGYWTSAQEAFTRGLEECLDGAGLKVHNLVYGEAWAVLYALCRMYFEDGRELLAGYDDPMLYDCMLFEADGTFWGHTWDVVDGQAC